MRSNSSFKLKVESFVAAVTAVVSFQVIKDYQLMAIVCVLVLLDVLVLSIWEFIDPLDVVVYNKTMEYIVIIRRIFFQV
jgi:hypothetical protein